jgi:hypothetical protein
LDVAKVQVPTVEWQGEEEDEAVVATKRLTVFRRDLQPYPSSVALE